MIIEHRGCVPHISDSAFIAPTAVIVGDVEIGDDASIWFGVVIRAEGGHIRIGDRVAVEDNAIIHAHEGDLTIIGTDVTIGHGAMLDGCTIGPRAQIGGNAVVLHGATVGEGAVVASSSAVVAGARVEPHTVVLGCPAQPAERFGYTSDDFIPHTADDNARLAQAYRREGLGDPARHEAPTSYGRRKRHVVSHEETGF